MATQGFSTYTNTSGSNGTTQPQQQSSTTQQTGTSTTNASGSQTTSSYQQNMTDEALAALNMYIAQLMGGGTQQMAQDEANRRGEINTVRAARAGYSKEAAFADAQGLISQTMRRSLEAQVPTITRAAEGAGTSQNAMRALLAQDASQRAAESASVAGLTAATNYGGINAQFSSILENLTKPNDQVANALAQALSIAKGSISKGDSTTNSSQTSTTESAQNSTTEVAKTFQPTNQSSQPLVRYGAQQQQPDFGYVGSTQDTLNQLWSDTKFVDNITF